MKVGFCMEREFGVGKKREWHGEAVCVGSLITNFKAIVESPLLSDISPTALTSLKHVNP